MAGAAYHNQEVAVSMNLFLQMSVTLLPDKQKLCASRKVKKFGTKVCITEL